MISSLRGLCFARSSQVLVLFFLSLTFFVEFPATPLFFGNEELKNENSLWTPTSSDSAYACGPFNITLIGESQLEICKYLLSLLPSTSRFVPPNVGDEGLVIIEEDVISPACFLTVAQRGTDNANYVFLSPLFTKPIERNPIYGRSPAILALRNAEHNSLTLTVFSTLHKSITESTLTEDMLEGEKQISKLEIHERVLPGKFHSNINYATGHILETANQTLVAVHQGYYQVGIFAGKDMDSLEQYETHGFDGFGGEVPYTLFEHLNRLFLAGRYNIRQSFNQMSGLGYRQAGIYEVFLSSRSSPNRSAFGKLVTQWSDDQQCCQACGGCAENNNFSGCHINTTKLALCNRPPNLTGIELRDWHVHNANYKSNRNSCERNSTINSDECESFLTYHDCVHKCRQRTEVYASTVGRLGGSLMAVANWRDDNRLSLCRIGAKTLRFLCFPSSFLSLKNAILTHPLSSGLAGTQNNLVLAEVTHRDTDKIGLLHAWPRHSFCFVEQKNSSVSSTLNFTLRTEKSLIAALFRPKGSKECANFLGGNDSEPVMRIRFPSEQAAGKEHVASSSEYSSAYRLCKQEFQIPIQCATACRIFIEFKSIYFHGLIAVAGISGF